MRWLAPLIALVVAAAPALAAPPTVEIKARTQLVYEHVRLLSDGRVEVRGALVDRLTGDSVPDQLVHVRIGTGDDAAVATATTDADGKFRALFSDAPPGPQEIGLTYAGTDRLDGADPFTTTTDPARALAALTIRAEDAPGGATLHVTATVDERAEELPIELLLVPPAAAPVRLAATRTGVPFPLTRARAGGPGPQRVRAVYAGDDTKQPATAEVTVELTSSTTTTLDASTANLAYEDELVITGAVTDEDGKPVARAAVTLVSGDRRLAQGATAANGTYRFEIEGEILGQGQFPVRVRTIPATTALRPSDSPPSIIKIAAPQPVPISYTVAAAIATALAAGGFFTARAKPWLRFRRPAPPAEAPANGGAEDAATGGLVVSKPGIVATMRRASDDGFDGVVRDTVRGRAVPEAVVRLLSPGDERELRTGADGAFSFEHLAAADWRAEVAAAGHVTERFTVTIPHRGELRGVRVDLVPVRERVFQLYRRAAEPLLPDPRMWGIWSPRQIIDHVRGRAPSAALADLTDFVEEIYFSARVAAEAVLPRAAERVELAIRERAG